MEISLPVWKHAISVLTRSVLMLFSMSPTRLLSIRCLIQTTFNHVWVTRRRVGVAHMCGLRRRAVWRSISRLGTITRLGTKSRLAWRVWAIVWRVWGLVRRLVWGGIGWVLCCRCSCDDGCGLCTIWLASCRGCGSRFDIFGWTRVNLRWFEIAFLWRLFLRGFILLPKGEVYFNIFRFLRAATIRLGFLLGLRWLELEVALFLYFACLRRRLVLSTIWFRITIGTKLRNRWYQMSIPWVNQSGIPSTWSSRSCSPTFEPWRHVIFL